jgi:(5-formylfuran-3-yl)methyl phosphate synthase
MTGLLVSVRSAVEAEIALAGGADIIDVKEPRRGALGPADPSVWKEILQKVGNKVATSAALGELMGESTIELAAQTRGFSFAKVGLSNWRHGARIKWFKTVQDLPPSVLLVPVIYADAKAAGWKSLFEAVHVAISLASDANSGLILIDTFQKQGRTLLDLVFLPQLQSIIREAAAHRIRIALAGSLDEISILELSPLEPVYIGVRGAACIGGRDGTIDLARVKSLARLVHGARQKAAS